HRRVRPRTRREALRYCPYWVARCNSGRVVGHRSSIRDEYVRAIVLDRMRLRGSAHDQDTKSKVMDSVWRSRWSGTRKQILHLSLRIRIASRALSLLAAKTTLHTLALRRRRRRASDLFAQPDLERPPPLALSRIDAQHPRDGQGHRIPLRPLFHSANCDDESVYASVLARRPVVSFLFPRGGIVPRFRVGLPHRRRVFLHFPREGLLFSSRILAPSRRRRRRY